ncbi:MAG TPA: formyltetrahydrofolate deformylase [Candidatus Omnitrophota bacterium]|nr:formyltetrahydrofolate deformylase [Candidatus Omnitrophota bacterium]
MNNAILLISCPDQRGITAGITDFIYKNNGNILHADQHIDDQHNIFFMRVEWSLDNFKLKVEDISATFKPLAQKFKMSWELYFTGEKLRAGIFVSKPLHCLYDLLSRQMTGQLGCLFPLIISNHREAGELATKFGIKFHYLPIDAQNKKEQEKKELEILKKERIDLIILARYHQILSRSFIEHYPHQIINIHHSFLPAFAGKDPYAQAYAKGVKLIGATSHYVNEELDQGPIIEQGTVRVSHRDSLEDLKDKGQDLEKIVLYRAVRLHIERKILCYHNKTVVFG